jgi:hypothetical protein
MPTCMQCDDLHRQLREVKHALRTLDESQARGPEYFEEHERLEERRGKLLEAIAQHEAGHETGTR